MSTRKPVNRPRSKRHLTWPLWTNLEDFGKRIAKIDTKLGEIVFSPGKYPPNFDKRVALKLLAEMLALISGWCSAYRECDDLEEYVQDKKSLFDHWLKDTGLTIEQVKGAVDPSMGYAPSDYAFKK